MTLSDLGSAGPVLMLLAFLSVLSVAVIVARGLALSSVAAGREQRDDALAALEQGDFDAAGKALLEQRNAADRVARRAIELVSLGATPRDVEADLSGMGNEEVAAMGKGLRLLDLVGMVGPLLGLLGTVLGMIQSFRSLELAAGSANASILAGGIWQALLTTAAGLLVAIPALAGASYLASRIEAGTLQIERVVARASVAASRGGAGRLPRQDGEIR